MNKFNKRKEQVMSLFDSDIISYLAGYARLPIEVESLEEMLNNSIKHIMKILPGGEENYGKISRIGEIYICRFNNDEDFLVNIEYVPCDSMQRKVKYIQSRIGIVNLEYKTYFLNKYSFDEPLLKEYLEPDVHKTMEILGLEKVDKKLITINNKRF